MREPLKGINNFCHIVCFVRVIREGMEQAIQGWGHQGGGGEGPVQPDRQGQQWSPIPGSKSNILISYFINPS